MKEKFVYRNLKHVILHGIAPFGIGEFDHPIAGGGIELIEQEVIEEKENKRKSKKNMESD